MVFSCVLFICFMCSMIWFCPRGLCCQQGWPWGCLWCLESWTCSHTGNFPILQRQHTWKFWEPPPSFQVHVVLLDPGYILEHTPLASRFLFLHLKLVFGRETMKWIFRQESHYEAMSAKGCDQKDFEEFQKFSHIFSNCLPKPGLKMLELESIYRFQ